MLISRLYLGAAEQPADFFNLRMKDANGKEVKWILAPWLEDPAGKNIHPMFVHSKKKWLCSFETEFFFKVRQ